MVRFNLFKACFEQLQESFVKLSRLVKFLQLEAYETDTLNDAIKQAFDIFADYCSNVMRLRKKEVIEEQKVIDTTPWQIDSDIDSDEE